MIFNVTGSGGVNGTTLTVTAPASVTATVSKGAKTKTKTTDSAGKAVFRGLESGVWTVTITDGSQTASKQVAVTLDYAASLTFFSATIRVTYPVGSVCTCSDGTTTLTAPDTSGSAVFTVPNAGTWTVKITSGGKVKTAAVQITAGGQSKSVAIDYILYLYNRGDQCTAVTGGWEKSCESAGVGNLTAGNAYLIVQKGAENDAFGAAMVNEVDMTGYTTLHAIVSRTMKATMRMAVGPKFPGVAAGSVENDVSTVEKEMTLDISQISGKNKVLIRAKETTSTSYIHEVWLS